MPCQMDEVKLTLSTTASLPAYAGNSAGRSGQRPSAFCQPVGPSCLQGPLLQYAFQSQETETGRRGRGEALANLLRRRVCPAERRTARRHRFGGGSDGGILQAVSLEKVEAETMGKCVREGHFGGGFNDSRYSIEQLMRSCWLETDLTNDNPSAGVYKAF